MRTGVVQISELYARLAVTHSGFIYCVLGALFVFFFFFSFFLFLALKGDPVVSFWQSLWLDDF